MMSANLDALATSEEPASGRSTSLDSVVAPAVNAQTRTPVVTASLLSSWPAALPASSSRVRELAGVIALSAFLHAGLAAAAFRVEIELARPPKPEAKPVVVPPLPPKPMRQDVAPRPREVVEKPVALVPLE